MKVVSARGVHVIVPDSYELNSKGIFILSDYEPSIRSLAQRSNGIQSYGGHPAWTLYERTTDQAKPGLKLARFESVNTVVIARGGNDKLNEKIMGTIWFDEPNQGRTASAGKRLEHFGAISFEVPAGFAADTTKCGDDADSISMLYESRSPDDPGCASPIGGGELIGGDDFGTRSQRTSPTGVSVQLIPLTAADPEMLKEPFTTRIINGFEALESSHTYSYTPQSQRAAAESPQQPVVMRYRLLRFPALGMGLQIRDLADTFAAPVFDSVRISAGLPSSVMEKQSNLGLDAFVPIGWREYQAGCNVGKRSYLEKGAVYDPDRNAAAEDRCVSTSDYGTMSVGIIDDRDRPQLTAIAKYETTINGTKVLVGSNDTRASSTPTTFVVRYPDRHLVFWIRNGDLALQTEILSSLTLTPS